MHIPNPLQCYSSFKHRHHERSRKLHGRDELCRRCGIIRITHDESRCPNSVKCISSSEDHPSTSRACSTSTLFLLYLNKTSFVELKQTSDASVQTVRQ